jgi:hypothetical protein
MIRHPLVLKMILIRPKTVIHIGGGTGQDGDYYKILGAKWVLWGEVQTSLSELISNKFPRDIVINKRFGRSAKSTLIKSETTVDLETESRGLLQPIMMVVDTDGADLEVLAGADKTLKSVSYLVLEQHRNWENGEWHAKLTDVAYAYGFKRTISRYSYSNDYEDVLYTRRNIVAIFVIKLIDFIVCQFKQIWHLLKLRHLSTSYFYCQKCGR